MRPTKWTKEAIDKAFDDFVKQHGRLPTKDEMYGKYKGSFPWPLSVKTAGGMTVREYFETYYARYLNRCRSKVYSQRTKEYWVKDFKTQYINYGCPSEDEYNRRRRPNTPNTQTFAKIIGVVTWGEVLDYCGFEKYPKAELSGEVIFDETPENYRRLNIKLQEVLSSVQHRKTEK